MGAGPATDQNRSQGMSEQSSRPKARPSARPTRRAKARPSAKPVAATGRTAAKKAPSRAAGAHPSRSDALRGAGEKVGAVRERLRDPRSLLSEHRGAVVACAAALVLLVALYGPACGLYQAWRENGTLQAEQAQASAESEELEGDISSLMTEEGIKDEARRRGYVEEGETRIVVEGAGEEGSDETATSGDATDDTPWYLRVADFVFQYRTSDEGEK